MDDREQYFEALTHALTEKSEQLERSLIVGLREKMRGFEASFGAIYKFLIEKGLIQDDPYRGERSVTEIQIPSSDPFAESDRIHEMSLRLSHYHAQWEFLVNIFHVSVNNMSLKKVKLILELLDYIHWTDFSVNSSYQITRSVANIMAKVAQMNDPMAGKVITSEAAQLRERTKEIRNDLKTLTGFLRERYKFRVRGDLIMGMAIDAEAYRRSPNSILRNIKFEFGHRMGKLSWYKELIEEILKEDFGEQAEALRAKTLDKLKVVQITKTKKKATGPDDKTVMLGILDTVAKCSEPIRSTIIKMNDNSRTIQERKKSFGERLKLVFSNLFGGSNSDIEYEIAIKDAVTGIVRHELVNYTRFAETTTKKSRMLQELQDRNSATFKRSRLSNSDQIWDFLNKNIQDLKGLHRTLSGLDEFFQSDNVPPEVKPQMKGSSLNLKNLKGHLIEANRETNEFKASKQEEAQLKKLGIEE